MTTVAETATLAHGYTMADVESITRHAMNSSRRSMMLDQIDRRECAWYAIVEHLYAADEPPQRGDLLIAALTALSQEAADHWRHAGLDHDVEMRPSFARYWLPISGPAPDFTEQIAERLALPQVLSRLSATEYEAVAALAAHGSQIAGATAIGVPYPAFKERISRAREKVLRAWLEGETPHALRKVDPDVECRAGHARAEHGRKNNAGAWVCRVCSRNSMRRARARSRKSTTS